MTQAIRIGDLIGFDYQGNYTVGEVLGIDERHPVYDRYACSRGPKTKVQFVPTFTVKIDESGLLLEVLQSSAQPPF